jgi:hypothetical protein
MKTAKTKTSTKSKTPVAARRAKLQAKLKNMTVRFENSKKTLQARIAKFSA